MGCDYYADENGTFEVVYRDYETGRELGRLTLTGLKPRHPISREIIEGDVR